MADNPKREFELGLLNDASSAIRDAGELLKKLIECSGELSASHPTADFQN